MEERRDQQAGNIAAAIYNVNTLDKDKWLTSSDFAYPTMEEYLRRQEEMEQLQENEDGIETNDAVEAWNQRVARLTAGRKPTQTTFNG